MAELVRVFTRASSLIRLRNPLIPSTKQFSIIGSTTGTARRNFTTNGNNNKDTDEETEAKEQEKIIKEDEEELKKSRR